MNRIYHLSTCDTCRKILAQLKTSNVELINLRGRCVSPDDLDIMFRSAGSYEALFNKKAQKWKAMAPEVRPVSDEAYRALILEEYTFLKRPAAMIGKEVFVGNDAKTVEALKKALHPG
jgi:arsenate reductase